MPRIRPGERAWTAGPVRLANLGLGDFDGNGRTDVFSQSGDRWLVSYGGTSGPTLLPAGSNIPIKSYGFGDFDGDDKTRAWTTSGCHREERAPRPLQIRGVMITASLIVRVCADLNKGARSWSQHLASASLERSSWSSSSLRRSCSCCAPPLKSATSADARGQPSRRR